MKCTQPIENDTTTIGDHPLKVSGFCCYGYFLHVMTKFKEIR